MDQIFETCGLWYSSKMTQPLKIADSQPVGTESVDAAVNPTPADVEILEVERLRLCDLFPVSQITDAHQTFEKQTVLKVVNSSFGGLSKFARRIHDACAQLYQQTARRHRRLAIEDDLFFHADKVQRVEQARKYYRDGTRLYQAFPSRKKPLSTLLHPTTLLTDKRIVLKEISPTSATSATSATASSAMEEGKGKNTFPGSIPQSLMESDIPKIWDSAYFFAYAPKTNGLRFFAVGCHFGHSPWIALINRSQQIFLLPGIVAPDVLFDGTVFDGELVTTKTGKFAYIVYESAMTCGVPCSEYNYLVRLQTASLLVEAWNLQLGRRSFSSSPVLVADEKHPLQKLVMPPAGQEAWIKTFQESKLTTSAAAAAASAASAATCDLDWRVKRVFSDERFYEMVTMEIPALDHDTDGYIITAVEPPIQIGQTSTIFKIKRSTDHTLDFLAIVLNRDEEHATDSLYVDLVALNNRGVSQLEAGILWDTLQIPWSQIPALAKRLGYKGTNYLADVDTWLHGKIVECRYSHHTRKWEPEGLRLDKNTPNKVATADKTWRNVVENLSLLQIFPEGSLPEETRKRLQAWEESHPDWKPLAREMVDPHLFKQSPYDMPQCMAPATLARLITFK